MTKKKSTRQPTKTGRYSVGRASFAKISAVEGIHLTDAMQRRADEKRVKGLSAEEYRRTIIRTYRKS